MLKLCCHYQELIEDEQVLASLAGEPPEEKFEPELIARVEELKGKGISTTKRVPENMLRDALAPSLTDELFPESVEADG